MKSMPYSALVLELVHVFETSARTSSMTSYNAAFQRWLPAPVQDYHATDDEIEALLENRHSKKTKDVILSAVQIFEAYVNHIGMHMLYNVLYNDI